MRLMWNPRISLLKITFKTSFRVSRKLSKNLRYSVEKLWHIWRSVGAVFNFAAKEEQHYELFSGQIMHDIYHVSYNHDCRVILGGKHSRTAPPSPPPSFRFIQLFALKCAGYRDRTPNPWLLIIIRKYVHAGRAYASIWDGRSLVKDTAHGALRCLKEATAFEISVSQKSTHTWDWHECVGWLVWMRYAEGRG